MCSAHGQKLKKRGNPEVWSKTLQSGQCWQYQRHFSTILCKQIQEQRPKRAINKRGESGGKTGEKQAETAAAEEKPKSGKTGGPVLTHMLTARFAWSIVLLHPLRGMISCCTVLIVKEMFS